MRQLHLLIKATSSKLALNRYLYYGACFMHTDYKFQCEIIICFFYQASNLEFKNHGMFGELSVLNIQGQLALATA